MNDQIDAPEAPMESKPYLKMITDAEQAFSVWQGKCDSIDGLYANLKKMAEATGDREFQIFWANMEVLRPTVYSRAPVPVVVPRHRSGGELQRKASELLERVLAYDVEADDLHDTLLQVRDDMALTARGVAWVLDNGQCIHVDRRDFVHEPGRKWAEVGWVARRAYLTRKAMQERFPEVDLTKAKFEHVKDKDADDDKDYHSTAKKAAVWEMWHKSEGCVIWLTEGVDTVLDVRPPLFDVKGFFPCPRPAYGTLERRTLRPVPDFVYYRDQVDEINELTARISSLSESLRLKGFYASGTPEIGDAIEAAMKATDNRAIMVPVSSAAALSGASLKDSIIWLPVREVAEVITALVALRKQLIDDVYQITGLSDIMRGATEATETATAQNLKAQYGSVRVKERQAEMVRIARDVLRIKAEVYAEQYPAQDLAEIAQMELKPEATAAQEMMQAQAQGQPIDPAKVVTLEQVDALLKSQKLRPFALEVESDSTIAPNEEAEKEARIEFITAMGGFINQAGAMVQAQPQTAPFAAEMMKFAAGAFRAGRELGSAIDEFAETVKGMAQQPQQQQPDPKAEADAMLAQAQAEKTKAEIQIMMQESELRMEKMNAEILAIRAKIAQGNQPSEAA